jgi:hypothetical protein
MGALEPFRRRSGDGDGALARLRGLLSFGMAGDHHGAAPPICTQPTLRGRTPDRCDAIDARAIPYRAHRRRNWSIPSSLPCSCRAVQWVSSVETTSCLLCLRPIASCVAGEWGSTSVTNSLTTNLCTSHTRTGGCDDWLPSADSDSDDEDDKDDVDIDALVVTGTARPATVKLVDHMIGTKHIKENSSVQVDWIFLLPCH